MAKVQTDSAKMLASIASLLNHKKPSPTASVLEKAKADVKQYKKEVNLPTFPKVAKPKFTQPTSIGPITPQESIAGTARMAAHEAQPKEIFKKSDFYKFFTAPSGTKSVSAPGGPFDMMGATAKIPFDVLRGVHGGIEEATGKNLIESVFKPKVKPVAPSVPLSGSSFIGKQNNKMSALDKFAYGFQKKAEYLGGNEPYSEDPEVAGAAEILFPLIFDMGRGYLTKAAPEIGNLLAYKNIQVPGSEVKLGLKELTSGVKSGASPEGLKLAQELIKSNNKGQEIMNAIKNGGTIKQKRDFVKWTKEWLGFKPNKTPEIAGLLGDLKAINIEKAAPNVIEGFFDKGRKILKPEVPVMGVEVPKAPVSPGEEVSALLAPKVETKESPLITAVERAVGKQQAQEYRVDHNKDQVFNILDKSKIDTEEQWNSLYNYFDNPEKYPLPPEMQLKLGDENLNKISDYKKFLTSAQEDRGLLQTVIDDDHYIRAYTVQLDGSKPTASQINELQKAMPSGLQKRLLGIAKGEGVSGLSLKNRYDQSRVFKNADERDKYLEKFGLKTNRNFVEVLSKMSQQVKKITSNYDLVNSLREQAKQGVPGVKEVYDPKVFKDMKDSWMDSLRATRESILNDARAKKIINKEEYALAKERTEEMISGLKTATMGDTDIPKDLRDIYVKDLNLSAKLARTGLFEDLKAHNAALNNLAKAKIDQAKADYESKLNGEINRIGDVYATAIDEGMRRPSDVKIAQQMTGLMFDEVNARAIDNVMDVLKPSNLEDIVRGFKLVMATGDLFQLPEIVRQRFGAQGVAGLFKPWGYSEKEFYEEAVTAVERGLLLEKPSDIDIELVKKFGSEFEDIERSFVAMMADKVTTATEKVPIIGHAQKAISKTFKSLEDVQFKWALPQAKLSTYKAMVPEMRKKYPNMTDEEVETKTATVVNDLFQGLNWNRLMTTNSKTSQFLNKRRQRVMRIAIFGPDRLRSIYRRYSKSFTDKTYAKFFIRTLITGELIRQTINYALNGHSTLENERGGELKIQIPQITDEKGNPMQLDAIGTWNEPYKFLYNPKRFLLNKMGVLGQVAGVGQKDYYSPETIKEWAWETTPKPFVLENLIEGLMPSDKLKTGEAPFGVKALQAGTEFMGFPASFVSGENPEANFLDLIKGEASFDSYIMSRDKYSDKEQLERDVEKMKTATPEEKAAFIEGLDEDQIDKLEDLAVKKLENKSEKEASIQSLRGDELLKYVKKIQQTGDRESITEMVNSLTDSQIKSIVEQTK